MKLYKITIKQGTIFFVVDKDPTSAVDKLAALFTQKDWYRLSDRAIIKIEIIASTGLSDPILIL